MFPYPQMWLNTSQYFLNVSGCMDPFPQMWLNTSQYVLNVSGYMDPYPEMWLNTIPYVLNVSGYMDIDISSYHNFYRNIFNMMTSKLFLVHIGQLIT